MTQDLNVMGKSAPDAKASFAPVADAQTRVLVLGSLPGDVSLLRSEYYAHPRNQFWRLMSGVVGIDLLEQPYGARLAALLSAGVGLWDVVHSAERVGSLDANIRAHRPNALEALAVGLPSLRVLAFNGAKAFEIGRKQLTSGRALELISLPSSSPAHAIPFERKEVQWRRLTAYLVAGA
jgi:TDG/mug DNA glycosylase family protein